VLRHRLAFDHRTKRRLIARDPSPTGDAELDVCLARFSKWTGDLSPRKAVREVSWGSEPEYARRLVDSGVLRVEVERRRWRKPVTHHRLVDRAVTGPIHRRIATALAAPERADLRAVLLIHIVSNTDGLCEAIAGDFPPIDESDGPRKAEKRAKHAQARASKLAETFRQLVESERIRDETGCAADCCEAVENAVLALPWSPAGWAGGG
jgi:Golgi phosphoprotein 3 GPP34